MNRPDTVAEKDVKRLSPILIEYGGKEYSYVMNTGVGQAATTSKAAENTGTDLIYMAEAYDMRGLPAEECVAVYVQGRLDKASAQCAKLVGESVRLVKEYRSRMIAEGRFRPDTPLREVYLGCGDSPDFKYFV